MLLNLKGELIKKGLDPTNAIVNLLGCVWIW
jgi:hypothetical protein